MSVIPGQRALALKEGKAVSRGDILYILLIAIFVIFYFGAGRGGG